MAHGYTSTDAATFLIVAKFQCLYIFLEEGRVREDSKKSERTVSKLPNILLLNRDLNLGSKYQV
jgi:hypothetical protein